jgi:hypothetical protein
MNTANDNFPAAGPGSGFYPEMGERHDGKALFVSHVGYGGYGISWQPDRHVEALVAFKLHRIRPRYMSQIETIHGTMKWSAGVTWAAGDKLQRAKLSVLEMLLD